MYMSHGITFSFVQTVVLLAVSFFVLLSARKSDSQNIKIFGYVIAILLWVAAALVLGQGISGRHQAFQKMHMMGHKFERPMGASETPQEANPGLPAK